MKGMKIAQLLTAWFAKHKRPLPWRKTRDPYRIWVSEIMLQQTQVATVLPYYRRWLKRFPTVRSLAEASLDEVLKHWEGLGYYRRARMMHRAAQEMVKRHGGQVPRNYEEIRALPGIGRYTAGAVASIAFDLAVPLIDGNAARVLARLFAVDAPIDRPEGEKVLWELARRLVPEKNPGDFNQALMELGATVCLPRGPRCLVCPVARHCAARKSAKQEEFPRKARVPSAKKVQAVCGIVMSRGRILIEKRPENGLWAGLWQFPTFKVREGEQPARILEKGLAASGITARDISKKGTIKRSYTDHRENLHVFQTEAEPNGKLPPPFVWVTVAGLERYAFPSAYRKIIRRWLLSPAEVPR